MKKLTRIALYEYLLAEQGKIQSALDQDSEGPLAEVQRGAWAMAQRIVEDFKLGPKNKDLH